MPSKKIRFANAVLKASILTILFIVAITIRAEFSKNLKDSLARNFGHHWVGKGELASILFVVLVLLLYIFGKSFAKERYLILLIKSLFLVTVLGTLTLAIFFTWHFFAVG